MTSHELRTPATIAVGYAELLRDSERDASRRADLGIVLEELQRVLLGSDRLVRMLWMPDQDAHETLNLAAILADVRERWQVVGERDWQVDAHATTVVGSLDRVRACLDTLIENSLRYTAPGDVIRLVARTRGDQVEVGVEDSGPGFDPALLGVLKHVPVDDGDPAYGRPDARSQTGLGLGLVREAIAVRGGRVVIGRSPEGDAQVLMVAMVSGWNEGPGAVDSASELDGTCAPQPTSGSTSVAVESSVVRR